MSTTASREGRVKVRAGFGRSRRMSLGGVQKKGGKQQQQQQQQQQPRRRQQKKQAALPSAAAAKEAAAAAEAALEELRGSELSGLMGAVAPLWGSAEEEEAWLAVPMRWTRKWKWFALVLIEQRLHNAFGQFARGGRWARSKDAPPGSSEVVVGAQQPQPAARSQWVQQRRATLFGSLMQHYADVDLRHFVGQEQHEREAGEARAHAEAMERARQVREQREREDLAETRPDEELLLQQQQRTTEEPSGLFHSQRGKGKGGAFASAAALASDAAVASHPHSSHLHGSISGGEAGAAAAAAAAVVEVAAGAVAKLATDANAAEPSSSSSSSAPSQAAAGSASPPPKKRSQQRRRQRRASQSAELEFHEPRERTLHEELRAHYNAADAHEDNEFYTEKALLRRASVEVDPRVQMALKVIWDAFDDNDSASLDKVEYVVMHEKMWGAIFDGDLSGWNRALALKEWETDRDGFGHLNMQRFKKCWLTLADRFTDKVCAVSTASFLEEMIYKMELKPRPVVPLTLKEMEEGWVTLTTKVEAPVFEKSLDADLAPDETALHRPLSASSRGCSATPLAGSPKAAKSPKAPVGRSMEPQVEAQVEAQVVVAVVPAEEQEVTASPAQAQATPASPRTRCVSSVVADAGTRPVTVPIDTRLTEKQQQFSFLRRRSSNAGLEMVASRSAEALASRRMSTLERRQALLAAENKARREALAAQYKNSAAFQNLAGGGQTPGGGLADANELETLLDASRGQQRSRKIRVDGEALSPLPDDAGRAAPQRSEAGSPASFVPVGSLRLGGAASSGMEGGSAGCSGTGAMKGRGEGPGGVFRVGGVYKPSLHDSGSASVDIASNSRERAREMNVMRRQIKVAEWAKAKRPAGSGAHQPRRQRSPSPGRPRHNHSPGRLRSTSPGRSGARSLGTPPLLNQSQQSSSRQQQRRRRRQQQEEEEEEKKEDGGAEQQQQQQQQQLLLQSQAGHHAERQEQQPPPQEQQQLLAWQLVGQSQQRRRRQGVASDDAVSRHSALEQERLALREALKALRLAKAAELDRQAKKRSGSAPPTYETDGNMHSLSRKLMGNGDHWVKTARVNGNVTAAAKTKASSEGAMRDRQSPGRRSPDKRRSPGGRSPTSTSGFEALRNNEGGTIDVSIERLLSPLKAIYRRGGAYVSEHCAQMGAQIGQRLLTGKHSPVAADDMAEVEHFKFFETAVLLDEAEGKVDAESVQRMARETGSQALLFAPIPTMRVFESPTKSGDESSVMPSVVAVTPHVGAA